MKNEFHKVEHLHQLSQQELRQFIDESRNGKDNKKVFIGTIEPETAEKIKNICGEDLSDIVLDSEHVRHSYNKINHNLESDDILHSVEVINNAIEIKLSPKLNHGSKVLIFKGSVNGGIFFAEGIHSKNGYLSLITCYRPKKSGRDPDGTPKANPGANVQNDAPDN
ncbi:hypothetical protein FACS1894110_26340 [Spirochaetia bacterium]|nr:hypothetical protein FACS1894110_26340 [Spirochaetia bacterium]